MVPGHRPKQSVCHLFFLIQWNGGQDPLSSPEQIWEKKKKSNSTNASWLLTSSTIIWAFVLGTLTVEEIYKDRDQFASLVRKMASPDVGRMGIQILSFTIKEVFDNVTYLQSLGESNYLEVKKSK